MSNISFTYRDAKGVVSSRELIQWRETQTYLQGRCDADTFPKTYRKDRIVAFIFGEELLLGDAAPPAPTVSARKSPSNSAVAAAGGKPITPVDSIHQILFTGFAASQRAELERQAEALGMRVMRTAGKSLTFLCYGYNAGPSKVMKAQQAGAFIIDDEQFLRLIGTGEMP
ncbi:BRCT domain-containing protein [Pseudomonas coleopterorum]|uniref:BRCT domain-containing protein n=1 Tax=Pseudomonas coleopterorum TaxID=1605838 RepID=UPI0018D6DB72|nr:BRCT domain-containing protein [Pseudomonas coleopterorum]